MYVKNSVIKKRSTAKIAFCRDWECNKIGVNGSLDSTDITWQLVRGDPGRNIKVVLGGGRSSFLPANETEETSR
jgi:alkaline phosphatase